MPDRRDDSSGAPWWQRGVIYQVYPRSFQDSDGDGVGDLPGLVRRLDHLAQLGVDALWVSPFYASPMADFGYDVSDHCAVDPRFGTLDDVDTLLREAHARGLRVIFDYVPNHTSDRHPWFLDARRARDAERRAWYIWRDAAPDGGPPNNWRSAFGGSAWQWDPATRQYYLHTFLREQPDLDWRNPAVEQAMHDIMRFWFDRGVDGLRVDAIQVLVKDAALRDNPPNPDYREGVGDPYDALLRVHSSDRPEVHEAIARMRRLADSYPGERALFGELYNTIERVVAYYGEGGRGLHFPYNFQLLRLPWDARVLDAAIREYEALLPPGAWPNWVLGNHDRPRVASRVGAAQARVAAMLLLTLRGTPTIYYGDELGMSDVAIAPEQVRDPWELRLPGRGLGRDPVRTPMQWSPAPHAGFSTHAPWLPLADDWPARNVEVQRADPRSLLSLHRALLALRRREPALSIGAWQPLAAAGAVLAYTRTHGATRLAIALNLGAAPAEVNLPGPGEVALTTGLDAPGARVDGRLALGGDEGVIVRLR